MGIDRSMRWMADTEGIRGEEGTKALCFQEFSVLWIFQLDGEVDKSLILIILLQRVAKPLRLGW
jgi:hypothetical protein